MYEEPPVNVRLVTFERCKHSRHHWHVLSAGTSLLSTANDMVRLPVDAAVYEKVGGALAKLPELQGSRLHLGPGRSRLAGSHC